MKEKLSQILMFLIGWPRIVKLGEVRSIEIGEEVQVDGVHWQVS